MAIDRDICVVGGGIGGLAVATALAQRGARVSVLEQSAAIAEVGAGLQISPNGMRVMAALGLDKALLARSVVARAVSLRRAESDLEVARLSLDPADPYAFVHRADLIDILHRAARDAGVRIRLAQAVTRIIPGAKPQVVFKDPSAQSDDYDLVIDAGGLHSVLRSELNPDSTPFFTNQVAWRAIIPNTQARTAEVHVHMAPGGHVVSYPLRDSAYLNLVALQERPAWAEEGWSHRDDPAHLRTAFSEADRAVTRMLEAVRDVHIWGLFRHPVAARWYGQNVAMIGDAAHPTLPFLAQGAVMALEDAWALAACLDALPLVQALPRYQALRRARVTRVVETANGNAWRYHLPRGPVRLAAHIGLKTASTVLPFAMTAPFRWLYAYDVTAETP